MACDLSAGRKEPCKDSVGGIKEVQFVNFSDLPTSDITLTDEVVSAVAGTPNSYVYEVRDASSYTENIQTSTETGTTAYEQVVELTLKKLTKEDHKALRVLATGRPKVIIRDQNDNYFLAGIENGCQVTAGTIVTGQAMNDLSGYTLTITGMEKAPANFLDSDPTTIGFTEVLGV